MIEDDYLSELQLKGRATPALASLDRAGRVIHIGSFSKTLTPALRLGFVVAPAASGAALCRSCGVPRAGARSLGAARDRRIHARRPLYAASSTHEAGLCSASRCIAEVPSARAESVTIAGLAAVLRLPDGAPDLTIARETLPFGLAPTPLSLWYASAASARSGLLLGIATSPQKRIEASCDRLFGIIDRLTWRTPPRSGHERISAGLLRQSRSSEGQYHPLTRLG